MRKLKAKLNQKKAASIIYAMFLLAAASMVTAVVLSAARVEARRFVQGTEAEQRIQTLTSAAKLLECDIVGQASVIEETYYYEDGSEDLYISPGSGVSLFRGPLKDALSGCISAGSFTGSSSVLIRAEDLEPVECRFSMEEDESRSLRLLLNFSIPGESGMLRAEISSSKSVFTVENTADNEEKTPISSVTTTTYSWNHCEYSGGPEK